MLETIGNRDIPIPSHIDIFHLKNEIEASDKTALQCVMEVDEERMRLEAEAAELTKLGDEGSERYKCMVVANIISFLKDKEVYFGSFRLLPKKVFWKLCGAP